MKKFKVCSTKFTSQLTPSYPKTFIYYLNETFLKLCSSEGQSNFAAVSAQAKKNLDLINLQINGTSSEQLSACIAPVVDGWPLYTRNTIETYIKTIVGELTVGKTPTLELMPLFFACYVLLLNLESTQIVAANPVAMGFEGLQTIIKAAENQPPAPPLGSQVEDFLVKWGIASMSIISGLQGDVDYANFEKKFKFPS